MGDDADADWQAGLVEWGIEDTKRALGAKLGCRRCGGWGHVRTKTGFRKTCDLCDGTGNDPYPRS